MAANHALVVFAIGDRPFAVPAASVRELLRAVAITDLPGAPIGVSGVIDLRGVLVPVVDLRARLGIPPRPLRAADQLVICDVAFGPVAVRVDRVIELQTAAPDAIPAGAESDAIVHSLARTPDGVVVITDLSSFLAEADVAALATAVAGLGVAA